MRFTVVLLLAACAEAIVEDPSLSVEEATALVSTPGDQTVGYSTFSVVYRPVGASEDRALPVSVWFPATAGDNAQPVVYRVAGVADVDADRAVTPSTPSSEPHPVAIYSHGNGGLGVLAAPYAEHLASHGWIVVAPDHVGNTSLDPIAGTSAPFLVSAVDRPQDVIAVLDALDEGVTMEDGGALDVADTSTTVAFGHSFGGYTTLLVGGAQLDTDLLGSFCAPDDEDEGCQRIANPDVQDLFAGGLRDDRVVALVAQAPAFIEAFGDGLVLDVPTLLQTGDRDRTTTRDRDGKPAWAGLGHPDDVWNAWPDGGHYSFITICEVLDPALVNAFAPGVDTDGCGDDFTPVLDVVQTSTSYLTAAAEGWALGRGDVAAVLTGPALHPDVKVKGR